MFEGGQGDLEPVSSELVELKGDVSICNFANGGFLPIINCLERWLQVLCVRSISVVPARLSLRGDTVSGMF
jgi:hypothetical protein